MARTPIFVNPTGQSDNLGDSVLRRPFLDYLRTLGPLTILVSDSDDYASALGLRAEDRIVRSKPRWFLDALVGVLVRRGVFAVNAGEIVTGNRYAVRAAWQIIIAQAARMGNGTTLIAGAGIRDSSVPPPRLLRRLARLADFCAWRDGATSRAVGSGGQMPDWAFATGASEAQSDEVGRDLLALTFRGDRDALDDDWVRRIASWASARGLSIVVVVQVRRDEESARRIAHALGASVTGWPVTRNHAEHEAVLRDVYRRSAAVISDRIHALIIGMTEGAVPIAFSANSVSKARRVFEDITELPVADQLKDRQAEVHRWDSLAANEKQFLADLGGAQARLKAVRGNIGLSILKR